MYFNAVKLIMKFHKSLLKDALYMASFPQTTVLLFFITEHCDGLAKYLFNPLILWCWNWNIQGGLGQHHALQWRHNELDGISNHQSQDCLLNCLFTRRSKKTSKLHVTGLCVGNSPVTGEFPAQMASNMENVSIWWRHHDGFWCCCCLWSIVLYTLHILLSNIPRYWK